MIDKRFYAAADSEITQGQTDQALWVKIKTNNVGASEDVLRAKYIKLRARELATAETKGVGHRIWNVVPRWVRWTLWAIVVIWISFPATFGNYEESNTFSNLLGLILAITALYWIVIWVRRRINKQRVERG